MFIDEAEITVTGGRGGNGHISFFPMKKGPSGGSGGRGGDVYAVLDLNHSSLNQYSQKKEITGMNGNPGDTFNKAGANGQTLEIGMPMGTLLIDEYSGEEVEITKKNRRVLIARGGEGGCGNMAFKTATNQTPREATPGQPGQIRHLKLILKLIADYGLLGLPNAGKSSLLNELTAAHVRTAAYPFTTLEPNLGAINGKIIADIPGLIEGASIGRGLGIKFLKHIEKVKLLLHCISVESKDILKDYEVVNKELGEYNPKLLEKEMIILLTKIDLVDKKEADKKVKILQKIRKTVLPISILDEASLEELKKLLLLAR